MASFGGISVANSMFACLPCDEEAEIKKKNRGVQKKNDDGKAKKKENENQNKNKKKEKNSLQSAAMLSNKSKKKSQTPTPQSQPQPPITSPSQVVPAGEGDPDWTEWRERDAETVDTDFERNLQQALLLSKLEANQAQTLKAIADVDVSPVPSSASTSITKKKKKKNINSESKFEKTVSLATFLNETPDPHVEKVDEESLDTLVLGDAGERLSSNEDDDALIISPHIATLVPRAKMYEVEDSSTTVLTDAADEDDFIPADRNSKDSRNSKEKEFSKRDKKAAEQRQFIDQVQRDVGKIIRKEECTEFMKQNEHLISETVRSAHFQADIEQKDALIQEYEKEISTMKEEFAKVKKRNKQLAFIISQGEMQEKADLLTEIDELKEDKDLLTSQTAQLQQELEQERTKNHKLVKELQSVKGHKGGKQSSQEP